MYKQIVKQVAWVSLGMALMTPAVMADTNVGVRFIGEVIVPNDLQVDGTLVGGLSGLDYDRKSDTWILLSDDRSEHQPARFYEATLDYSAAGFASAAINKAVTLLQENGEAFPARGSGESTVVDPEAIRFDPISDLVWWTSEGDKSQGIDPFIAESNRQGELQRLHAAPAMFAMQADSPQGPHNNQAYEGLSFSPYGVTVWVAMEGPLYQDAELPTPEAGSITRLSQMDRDGQILSQFAYPLDAIPAAPGQGKYADNGVTEILVIDDNNMLVLERAGVQADDGSFTTYVRLYEVSLRDATDVKSLDALAGANFTPVTKRLVLDLSELTLSQRLDNIEGLAWGKKLANGHRSLVMVSDNNFNVDSQVTQVWAFEVTK